MRRGRGRGGRRSGGGGNNLNRPLESNGPGGKLRGTPQQLLDKYITLAREARAGRDRVLVEAYLQHAEHYQRLISEHQDSQPQQQPQRHVDMDDAFSGDDSDDGRGNHMQDDDNDNGDDDQPEVQAVDSEVADEAETAGSADRDYSDSAAAAVVESDAGEDKPAARKPRRKVPARKPAAKKAAAE